MTKRTHGVVCFIREWMNFRTIYDGRKNEHLRKLAPRILTPRRDLMEFVQANDENILNSVC